MKKFLRALAASVLGLFLIAGSAMAVTFGDGGVQLQAALDGITVNPSGNSSVNVVTDQLAYDSYWQITGSAGSVTTMVIELAGYAANNTFGIYSGSYYVQLFSGADTVGAQKTISILANGSVLVNGVDTLLDFTSGTFGYYLDSSYYAQNGGNGGLWHSDTSLNSDSTDHMAAYRGTNTDTIQVPGYQPGLWTNSEYILAFEDLNYNVYADGNFTDMVVIVESVNPVPEPATMLLLGLGLFGIGIASRKKN
jgi:hypothetical protein